MKFFALCLLLVAAVSSDVRAQVLPPREITPDTVVANVAGRDITAGEFQKIMRNWSPAQLQQFQNDPRAGLQQIYTFKYLAGEAEKKKLADEEPWKSQIEYAREGVMGAAMANFERNSFPVSDTDMESFYTANKSRYERSKIKIIKIGLIEPIPVGTSPEIVKQIAQIAVQNSHLPKARTEAEAKTLAADILKKLRAGSDFAELAKTYSEDEDSKTKGGDFGEVTQSSSHPPEIKKAVFALKPGETSEPVRQPNALYIIRLQERSAPPLEKIRTEIIDEIRNQHLQAFGAELAKRFAPKIIKPEFFLSSGSAKP
jgi:peptidyl-prolyl cis-trans isomerase C